MDKRPKKIQKFGASKIMFTPNLGYKRNVSKDSSQEAKVEVKIEHDASTSSQLSTQKQKKMKEKSTTQIQSVFSNMGSTGQGRAGSLRMGLSSGFRSYSSQGNFNSSGSFVKTEACQSIQQMQMFENNPLDIDDPMDDVYGPVRLPFLKKDKTLQIKSENSLEYPFQKNVYPSLSELMAPESLMTLQFYDSSFSFQPKISDIDLTGNSNNDVEIPDVKIETNTSVKMEYNGHNTENDLETLHNSQPIGKVQYYRSGRVVLIINEKEYELLKANEDKHHKELFSLTKIEEAEKPDKLVSLGTVPIRLKAVININCIIEHFLTTIK